jgi:hypothetical protein
LGSTADAWFKKTVIWTLRRWPVFSGLLKDRFPLNMSRSVMQAIAVLTTVGEAMLEDAEGLDRKAVEIRGLPLSYLEMSMALDQERVRDLGRYETWLRWRRSGNVGGGRFSRPPPASPHFTQWFHP